MEWISPLSTVVEVKVVSVHCVLQSELTAGLVWQPSNPEPAANIVHPELLQWLHVLRIQLTLPQRTVTAVTMTTEEIVARWRCRGRGCKEG